MSLRFARVIAQHRGLLRVKNEISGEEYWAEPSGNLRAKGDSVIIGDYVAVEGDGGRGRVVERKERRSLLRRIAAGTSGETQLIAANVDKLLIVTSANEDFSLRRIERYLALARQAETKALLILSKADLMPQEKRIILEMDLPAELERIWLSTVTGEGFSQLWEQLGPKETVILMGSSGVGKSSLTNELLTRAVQPTNGVREGDDKGRHTTTSRALFELANGSFLIDTPGIRELRLNADDEALSSVFQDIEEFARGCRFRDCRHASEPGCRVLEAIEKGELDGGRLRNHRKLLREQEALQRSPHQKVEARAKLKAMNKGLKDMYRKRGKS